MASGRCRRSSMRSLAVFRRFCNPRHFSCLVATVGVVVLCPLPSLTAANDEIIGWGNNTSGQTDPWSGLSGVVAIAAGYHHSLALRADGAVVGWGNDSWGQASGSSTVGQIGIAAGNSYSLSFGPSGYVNGWGEGYNGTVTIPGAPEVVAIAAGSSHALALRASGAVVSFGYYTNIPAGLSNMVAVAAGDNHSLALRADGLVVGWDYYGNDGGKFGIRSGLSNVVAIAVGGDQNLALRRDGTVVAWHVLYAGETNVPPGLSNVIAISVGSGHALALKADGTVVAWGGNWAGQSTVPFWLSNVVEIAAGGNHSLALRGSPAGVAAPVPVSPHVMIGTADRPFFQRILVKNTASSYGASGLPTGLTLNPATGIITGHPTTNGVYTLTLSATNSRGSASWTVPLHVNLPLPFVIVTNFARTTIGRPFELQPIWGNADTMEITGLPAGLSVDQANGTINGTPTVLGDYPISLLASNQFGVASNALILRVTELLGWGSDSSRQLRFPGGLSNVVAIAACGNHSVALRADGSVVSWVAPGSPSGVSNVVNIAAGFDHHLALRADGSVAAWGINTYGQTTIPTGLSNVIAIAAGSYHNLTLRGDGSIVSWGRNNFGQTNTPSGLNYVVAVAAGSDHNLALRADRTVVAWGRNNYDQTNVPSALSNVVAIAAGFSHNVALRADGSVVSWGYNYNGQTNTPSGLSNVVAIAAGNSHSLALRADGSVVGWGGYLGAGQETPPPGLSNVVAIAAGSLHSLALCGLPSGLATPELVGKRQFFATADLPYYERIIAKNRVTAYGVSGLPPGLVFNPSTGLITGQPTEAGSFLLTISATNAVGFNTWSVPLTVNPLLPSVQGGTLALAALGNWLNLELVRDAESVVISGLPPGIVADAQSGKISGAPTLVGDYGVSIAASNRFGIVNGALSIRVSSLMAWGNNTNCQSSIPGGLGNVVQVASGELHVLTLRADGRVAAWGANTFGQTNVPANLSNVVAVAAGGSHSLALRSDGSVVGWGNNASGQRTIPVGLSNVVTLAAGNSHSLALHADGSVVGWGNNSSGQRTIPVGLSNVVAIAAGNSHSLAVQGNGLVVGWGNNNYGQRTIPIGLSNVVALAAGSFHSLALRTDGSVVAWGQNTSLQASVPLGVSNVLAIAAGNTNSLALRSDGTVVVWGDNSSGQTNVPTGLSNIVALAAGGAHSLALVSAPADQPMISIQNAGGAKLDLMWQGLIGRSYAIQTTTNLDPAAGWSTIRSDLLQNSTSALTWTNAGEPLRFFRVAIAPETATTGLVIRPAAGVKLDLLLPQTSGGTYTIQTTTNLAANAVWSTIWSSVPGNGAIAIQWTNAGESHRYFRVIRP